MKAIVRTGTIDEKQQLVLDAPLTEVRPGRVKVVILPEDADIQETDWLRAASSNSAFSFLKDEGENVYSASDGKAYRDEG